MSIKSHAFGRVTLTDRDAAKFQSQVTYGRPKPAAVESVKKGVELSRAFQKNGSVRVTIRSAQRRAKDDEIARLQRELIQVTDRWNAAVATLDDEEAAHQDTLRLAGFPRHDQ